MERLGLFLFLEKVIMSEKKTFFRMIIGLLLIVGSIFLYLTIKFFFYENKVKLEIKDYNKSVVLYNKEYDKLDSTKKSLITKTNFYIIDNSDEFIEQIEIGNKDLAEMIEQMKIKVIFAISNLKMVKQNQLKKSDTIKFDEELPLFIGDTSIDKSLYYSIDELHELYEESEKKKNEMINKSNKK